MDPIGDLTARLPARALTTDPAEIPRRIRDRWALSLLREVRGDEPPQPAAVAFASSTEDVAIVLDWAQETRTAVVPRGGVVCGAAEAVPRSIVLDLTRMDRLLDIDTVSQVVEVQAGVRGDRLEDDLESHSLTLGH